MYLSEEHLKQIANNFGILSYIDKFYVSSTESITKSSGRLFQFVLQTLKLPHKKLLHIGDKFASDFFTPKELGIKSLYYYNKKVLKGYKKIFRAIKKLKYTNKAIDPKFITNFIIPQNYIKDDYTKISHSISSVLAIFAYQTLLDMHSKGIRKVFFFAREGILLQKIFNQILDNILLFQSKKHAFEFKVLYISRLSSSCAIYKDINNIDLLIETTQKATGSLSILNFIKTYGLSMSDFSNETSKIIESYQCHIDKNSFSNLLSHTTLGTEFNQLLKDKRNLLERYLAEKGVLAKGKIGLVDLGWGGTIQKNISHFLADHPSVEFFGYYFGTNNLIFDKNALAWNRSTFSPGCIVSYQSDYQSRKLNGAIPFLESLCGFDEIGTTIGYKSTTDGIIIPILDCSIKKNSYNIFLQKKIRHSLSYDIKEFCHLFNIASIPIEKLKAYAIKNFLNFIFNPKKINLKNFQHYKFNYNWSLNLENNLINTIKLFDLFKPKKLFQKIKKSPWRYGTIAAAPIPFLLAMYNLGYYYFNLFISIRSKIQKMSLIKKFLIMTNNLHAKN